MSDNKTLPDIPVEKIQEVAASHSSVLVKLRRTTPRGQWASVCPPLQKETLHLIQPEGWLFALAGGGAYQVQAFSCANPSEQVIPNFMVNIEGLPKQAMLTEAPAEWQAPGIPRRPQQPVFQGGFEMRDYQRGEQQNWERPPDAVASERARDERQERLSRERGWHQERDQMQAKLDALQNQINAQKEQHQREVLDARERAFEAKIDAALAGTKKPPTLDGASIAALAAAFAPVLIALVNSGKERAALSNDSTAKMHEMHLQGINTMLEATAKQPKGMDLEKLIGLITAAVPAVAPLVKAFFEDRSPAKTAEVITSMSQSSLEMLGMVTQILQQTVPESDNPWHQVAQNAIKSVGEVLERMATSQSGGQQRQLPEDASQSQPSQPSQQPQQPATTPEDIARAICAAPQVHPTLRTQDWEQVYVRLHKQEAPAVVAEAFAELLDQMAGAGTLPPFLERVFVDKQPSTYLAPFLYQLPISQNPQYVRAVLEAFDRVLTPEPAPAPAPTPTPKPQPVRSAVQAARPAARRPANGNGQKPAPRVVEVKETPEDLPELPPLEGDAPANADDETEAGEQLVGFDLESAENP